MVLLDYKRELDLWISNKSHFTANINILINDGPIQWYSILGKNLMKEFKYSFHDESLNRYAIKLTTPWWKPLSRSKKSIIYKRIGIWLVCGAISPEVLMKRFGEPLYHSEFGEGYPQFYEKEIPDMKGHLYASYFIQIDGVRFHIGYDHRGTSIDIQTNYNHIIGGKEITDRILKLAKSCSKWL